MADPLKREEGLCPHCGASECVGLTNGRAFCTVCKEEFVPPVAATPEEADLYARLAIEWRGYALNIARTRGIEAARFEHGIANLYTMMVPTDRRPNAEQLTMEATP